MAVSLSPSGTDKLGAFSGQGWYCVESGLVAIAVTMCPEVPDMAWVEQRGELFHVAFRVCDRRFKRTLKTADRRAADALDQRIDERLRLIEAGRIRSPQPILVVGAPGA